LVKVRRVHSLCFKRQLEVKHWIYAAMKPAVRHKQARSLGVSSSWARPCLTTKAQRYPGQQTELEAPLLRAVLRRGQQCNDVPFHVPGHKRGQGMDKSFKGMMGDALRYDTTEVAGMDFLGSPTGVIQEAQSAAARIFGADHTWFLVNGCTVGIHAAVMAVAKPGDLLLLARNCHQSAFAAMALTGCLPFWLQPETDPQFQVAHGITPGTLQMGLQQAKKCGRRVAGVLIVSPTYYGAASHVQELARICHEAGTVLLVDEAHGAHFGLHPDFPPSALQQGADIAIQSTHKMLSAMTQAAMLHLSGERVSAERVSRALRTLQSSSPSYLLLASLDAARVLAQDPEACFGTPLEAAKTARAGLSGIPGLSVLEASSLPGMDQGAACETLHCFNSVETYDPLRLTVGVSGWGLTGFEVARVLETRFHIVPELATQAVVLFMLGPGSALEDAHALVYAFEQLASEKGLQALPEASSDGTSSSVDALSCGNNGISRNRSSSSSSSSSSINHSNHSYDCDGSENGCGGSSTGRLGHSQTNLSIGRSIHVQHSPSKQFNTEPTSSNGHTHSRMNDTDGAGHGTSSISSIGLPHEQFIEHRQPEVRLSPRDALFASTHRVHHSEAVGEVCAELLCPYPPGVPLLFPGEVITRNALEALLSAAVSGTVAGASDPTLEYITVISEPAD